MRTSILPSPSPEAVARGQRFKDRQSRWRTVRRPIPHAEAERIAPAVLAALFTNAVRVVGPVREYAYRTELGQTVRLRVDNWHWYALDGTAQGRGLYELWAWVYDMPVSRAAHEIRKTAPAAKARKAA